MRTDYIRKAFEIYQKKHGGSLAEISILFVNVTDALQEAIEEIDGFVSEINKQEVTKFNIGDKVMANFNYRGYGTDKRTPTQVQTVTDVGYTADEPDRQWIKTDYESDWIDPAWVSLV